MVVAVLFLLILLAWLNAVDYSMEMLLVFDIFVKSHGQLLMQNKTINVIASEFIIGSSTVTIVADVAGFNKHIVHIVDVGISEERLLILLMNVNTCK